MPNSSLGVLAGERRQRASGVGGRADVVDAVCEQRRAGGDDDEGGDQVGEDGARDGLAFLAPSSSSRTPRSTTADCR